MFGEVVFENCGMWMMEYWSLKESTKSYAMQHNYTHPNRL